MVAAIASHGDPQAAPWTDGRRGDGAGLGGDGASKRAPGPAITDEEAGRLLNAVLDAGIKLIDTSIDHGPSEERIGRFVGHRRDGDGHLLASERACPAEAPLGPPRPIHTTSGPRTSGRGSSRASGGCGPTVSTSSRPTRPRAGPGRRRRGRSRR